MFTTYFTEHIPAIMREVNSLYDVDGLFTNAWPPLGRLPVCYCDQCRKLPDAGHAWHTGTGSTRACVELWKLYDGIAKEKKPDNLYFGNLGGGIHCTANLKQLGEVCEWFNCDNQGRGGDDTPIWGCALQGRVCSAVMKGKTSTNVTAAWSTGHAALAQRVQVARRSADVDERDRGQRDGAVVPLHRRRRTDWVKTAAGTSPAASTSTGWRSTTSTSPTSARSRISAW